MCAQEGIYETMRLGTKVRLLSDPFKADAAIETVYEAARAHGVEPEGGVLDLTKYYFGDVEAAPDIVPAARRFAKRYGRWSLRGHGGAAF